MCCSHCSTLISILFLEQPPSNSTLLWSPRVGSQLRWHFLKNVLLTSQTKSSLLLRILLVQHTCPHLLYMITEFHYCLPRCTSSGWQTLISTAISGSSCNSPPRSCLLYFLLLLIWTLSPKPSPIFTLILPHKFGLALCLGTLCLEQGLGTPALFRGCKFQHRKRKGKKIDGPGKQKSQCDRLHHQLLRCRLSWKKLYVMLFTQNSGRRGGSEVG